MTGYLDAFGLPRSSARRQKLSLDRVHPLHLAGEAWRRPARGALARQWQSRVRASYAAALRWRGYLTMAIFKDDGFVPDDWRILAPAEDLPPGGQGHSDAAALASDPRARAKRSSAWPASLNRGRTCGPVAPDLSRFALIAVAFPKFTDGRGYSLARQLRGAYDFAGELRACGEDLVRPAAVSCALRLRQFRHQGWRRRSVCWKRAKGLASTSSTSPGLALKFRNGRDPGPAAPRPKAPRVPRALT